MTNTQKYSSANTSQKQIPCTHKLLESLDFSSMLDYGCGKYDLLKEKVEGLGKKYFGFDPYNRSEEENNLAINQDVDLITCNNVLNVIESDEVIDQIVHDIAWRMPTYAVFCVYEGNKTGRGKTTKKDCFQRNMKAIEYMPLLQKYFGNVTRKGNVFICS